MVNMANITNNKLLLVDEANQTLSILNPIITQVIIAVVICFLGFIAGKIVQRLILKIFEISDFDRIFRRKTGLRVNVSEIVAVIAAYFIYLVAIVMALSRLNITTAVITTIVILLLIVLLLFVIFGLNNVFANLSAGIIVRFRKNIKAGEYIRVKDKNVEGYVIGINIFSIQLETLKDETVFIPNMVIFRSEIIKPKKYPGREKRPAKKR
jgi:small-conductance mechanosensitive channel